jgi:hypothetical protein
MAKFFEVPVEREDGSKGLQYVNIDAITYVDLDTDAAQKIPTNLRIYLNNGYWFTVVGPKAGEILSLIKLSARMQFKEGTGDA